MLDEMKKLLGIAVGILALAGCDKKEGTTSQTTEGPVTTVTTTDPEGNSLQMEVVDDPADCASKETCMDLALRLATTAPARSVVASQRACDFGDASACGLTAQYYYDEGATQDFARARAFAEKACTKRDPEGCATLALIHLNGQGVEADRARALEFAIRACDATPADSIDHDLAAACGNAGVLIIGASPADPPKARRYLERGCAIDVAQCTNLAVATRDGQVGPKDPAKAREVFKRACDRDVAESCNGLGRLLISGEGGPKDEALAKRLFAKACKAGSKNGCTSQKKYP